MNRTQERSLRTVCRKGGSLTLPTTSGAVTIEITIRERPNHPDRADAKVSETTSASFLKLNDWPCRELYMELAERLDDQYELVEGDA